VIVTFYSYKGGVGRSMALANVADILARRGARVLMVDFDLEAPGLEQYFEVPQASARSHPGLIDLLAAFKEALAVGGARQADFRDLDSFILPIYPTLPGGGSLHLMPAGRREGADLERYATAVRSFDWQDFYFNWEGELFFEWLRDQLTSDRYDLVLVDSRTGVTEMGGICSYQLADQIVMLCAANRQNLRGTENVAIDFTSERVMARRGDRPINLVVVPARIEQRDPALLEGFLHDFDAVFQRYFPARLQEEGLGARTLMIPYQPELAFEERVVTDPARGTERNRIAVAFVDLARAITLLAPENSRIAAIGRGDGGNGRAAPQYDVASRFSGYDVHLAGSGAIRDSLERLKQGLGAAGVEVFLDVMEPVPPEEWLRRSEQILFHSGLLLLVGGETTAAQQQALRSLLRANRGAKNRPVRVVALGEMGDGGLARALELDTEALSLPGGPGDPVAIEELTALARTAESRRTGTTGERTAPSRPSGGVPVPPVLAAEPVPTPPPASAAPSVAASHPFQGQDPFREEQSGFFFGREQLVNDLVIAVETHRRVWLLGPSSSGKTSAVQAGAFPRLRSRSTGRVLERVVVGRECVAAITTALGHMPRSGERHVLFVDEFERAAELPAAERDALLAFMSKLETDRPDVVLLIGACEDGIAQFRAPPLSLDPHAPSTVEVADFTTAELRAAIERPAERGGLAYEPGLVDRILSDAGRQATAAGLVQRTLSRLWDSRREGWLTNAAYERIGGIAAVVAEIADAALGHCADRSDVVDRILSRLIAIDAAATPSAEGQAPRQPGIHLRRRLCVPIEELMPAEGDAQPFRSTIRDLVSGGLLVTRANHAEEPCVELVHDATLARTTRLGERLASLVAGDQEFLLWRQRLGDGIARQERLTGGALREAQGWLDRRPGDLSSKERLAIQRATRGRWIALTARAALFIGIVAFAFIQWRQAAVDRANAAAAAAAELWDRGRYGDVVDSLNVAYAKYPFRDSLLLRRGQAYARRGDDSLAVADFTAALAINPSLTEARVARAATFLENGNYAEAMAQYEETLRRDSGAAPAYLGRAAARIQLKGSSDSSLADFSAAFKADSSLVDALFERGRLNEQLGNNEAAVKDFERFLSLTTDPTRRLAAETRLDALTPRVTSGPPKPAVRPTVTKATVILRYADPGDGGAIAQIARLMGQSGTLNVPAPELMKGKMTITVAELRYVQGDDRFAKDVRAAAEAALAKVGYLTRLEFRVLDQKRYPDARRGRLELWLPPLSRTVYSVPTKR
jgi:tetratricopeptide (TPR) repeat protein